MNRFHVMLVVGLIGLFAGADFDCRGMADDAPPSAPVRKITHVYPWHTHIKATIFWIGEGNNSASAWDEDWRAHNGGPDSPDGRKGYLPPHHPAVLNPFYVALPFNDLAFPDKAEKWVPSYWHRGPKDGKPVSACKDRWIEITNDRGDRCFAQWEDVGPLRNDDVEYVLGGDYPTDPNGAALALSPAVAKRLGLNEPSGMTRWHFVDAEDVPPGPWLAYDEQAVIYRALREMKQSSDPSNAVQLPVPPDAAKTGPGK